MIALSLYLISLGEEVISICPFIMGLVRGWESVPEFDVSPVRGAKCGKSGYFFSNIQSDTLEDLKPPLGNFLDSQQEGDSCLVSSSDCNSQGQRGFPKRTRAIPSAQRQRTGFNPAAWNIPVPSPRFLLAALSCPASSLQLVFALGS